MAADVSSLITKVQQHAVALASEALDGVLADLDVEVPDSDNNPAPTISSTRTGPKLRDSRTVTPVDLRGDQVVVTVAYTAEHAIFTDEGVEPHQIPVGGRAAQIAKGYPMRFLSPSGGGIVRAFEVNWQPGPGVQRNIGWFHRGLDGWSDHLADATSRVSS